MLRSVPRKQKTKTMTTLRLSATLLVQLIAFTGTVFAWSGDSTRALASQSKIVIDTARLPSSAWHYGFDKWTKGTYLRIDRSQLSEPSFYLFDKQGRQIATFSFAIPNADRIEVHDFDVAPDHSVVLCGDSFSRDGKPAYFVARVSPTVQQTKILRTTPYWPFLVSVAPDNSIWTIGPQEIFDTDGHSSRTDSQANVLRHFNPDGNLIASFQPKWKFRLLQTVSGFLVAKRDRIGWYAPSNGPGEYMEVNPTTGEMKVYSNRDIADGPGSHHKISGFALTDSGDVFIARDSREAKTRTLLRLNRTENKWEPVKMPGTNEGPSPMLKGSDGDLLIFSGPGALSFMTFTVVR